MLEVSRVRAYQRLAALTRDPQAWEFDPVTMRLIEGRVERRRRVGG